MRFAYQLAAAAALTGCALARPLGSNSTSTAASSTASSYPSGNPQIVLTSKNTVNGTQGPPKNPNPAPLAASLPLSFINNFQADGTLNAYVTGLDPSNNVVMLQPDGTFFYPQASGTDPAPVTGDVKIPMTGPGSTTNINIPNYISAARIWFAQGELQFFTVQSDTGISLVQPSAVNPQDPSHEVNWGFVELTNTAAGGIYANISYVDFVGLILGMMLNAGDGSTQTTPGLKADALPNICNDLKAQAGSDQRPWDKLCSYDGSGNPLRILSPTDYGNTDGGFGDYWDSYVNQVWTKYASQPLTIRTQGDAGDVKCTVSGDTLNCDGDNRGYAKPVAADIWGCNSGPFAIQQGDNGVHAAVVPRLCAAFQRSTLLLDGGDVQPSLSASSYYTQDPTNHYSQIVHKYEVNDKGYAFAYDDVNPDGNENASGVVSDANPQKLTIYVGGPPSS